MFLDVFKIEFLCLPLSFKMKSDHFLLLSVPEVSSVKKSVIHKCSKSPEYPFHVWIIPNVERESLPTQDGL